MHIQSLVFFKARELSADRCLKEGHGHRENLVISMRGRGVQLDGVLVSYWGYNK